MRFCTSELKTYLINAELRRRFKGHVVINITGVRRAESAARAKYAPADQAADGRGWNWRPILDWSTEEMFEEIRASGLEPHPAYGAGMSRVSCRFCIMSNTHDLQVAASMAESRALYARMVGLEVRSTFGFQGARWLAEVAPERLPEELRNQVIGAKERARGRVELEKRPPRSLMFMKGKPLQMPTLEEAILLVDNLRRISVLVGFVPTQTAIQVLEVYAARMCQQPAEAA